MGVVALNNAKRLRPVEKDVQRLLAHFTQAVEQGSAPTFSTFKKVWTQRHFSWIYLGNSTSLTTDHYVQSLYAMALDCLDVPIPEMPMSETAYVPTSPQAQPEPGANENGTQPSDMAFTSNQASDGTQAATASFSNTGDDDEQEGGEDNVSNDVDQDADLDDAEPDLTSRMAEDIPFSEAYAAKLDREQPASQAPPGSPSTQAPTLAGATLDDVNIDDEIGDFNGDILADLPGAPFSSPKPAEASAERGTATQHGLASSGVNMQDADTDQTLHNHAQDQPQAIPQCFSKTHTLQTDMAGQQQAVHHGAQPQQPQKSSAAAKASPAPVSIVSGPDNGLSVLAASIANLPQLAPLLVTPAAVNGQSASMPVASPAAVINDHSLPVPTAPAAGSNESGSASAAPATGEGDSAPLPAAPTLAPGSSGARLMAAVANRPPQPPAGPRRDMYSLDTSHQSQPNPTEVSLGSIFAIYCIYETQPGRTPIYLPLELLHQLLELAQECHAKGVHAVMRVLRQLMAKRAFVVGAVRRPPSRSAAAEAACNAPSRLAASSLSGAHSKAQKERDCVYHVQCMYRGLGIVGSLGPMCRAYKAAKQQACEKAGIQHTPKGIANLTVGAKLPQLLWNATKKMQPLVAQKKLRGPRRKRKKPGDSDPMDADQADADTAGADKDDDSGDELFLLDKGMADLGSDAEGDDQAPPDVEGLQDNDDDDDEIDVLEHVNLPAIGGRGAKAAMRRADQRRQRKEQAVRSWRKFEGNVLNGQRYNTSAAKDDDAAQQPQPGPAPMDWADTDHSIPAANNDHADSFTGQAVSNGAQANTQAAPSNGTALPRAPTPILAARAVPAQVAAAAYERSADAPQTSKAAADAAPAASSAAALTPAPNTGTERPASAGASTLERAKPGAAPRGKGKKGRPCGSKNRPGAGQAGAAPSSLQPASSAASSLAMSAHIPAKASAKPPKPCSARKRAAAESPCEQTGNLMAAESLADKGNRQQTKAAAQAPVCASDAVDPAGEDAVNAALKLMQDCTAEIAYMLDHPDSDLD